MNEEEGAAPDRQIFDLPRATPAGVVSSGSPEGDYIGGGTSTSDYLKGKDIRDVARLPTGSDNDVIVTGQRQATMPVQDVPQSPPKNPAHEALEVDNLDQDFRLGHIKPETMSSLYAKKDLGGKIGTMFGLLVAGAGAGLTHTSNPVLDMMQKEIDNDLAAQQKSNSNAQSWYKMALEHETQKSDVAMKNALTEKYIAETGRIPTQIDLDKAHAEEARARASLTPAQQLEYEAGAAAKRAQAQQTSVETARTAMGFDLFGKVQKSIDKLPPGPNRDAQQAYLDAMRGQFATQQKQKHVSMAIEHNLQNGHPPEGVPTQLPGAVKAPGAAPAVPGPAAPAPSGGPETWGAPGPMQPPPATPGQGVGLYGAPAPGAPAAQAAKPKGNKPNRKAPGFELKGYEYPYDMQKTNDAIELGSARQATKNEFDGEDVILPRDVEAVRKEQNVSVSVRNVADRYARVMNDLNSRIAKGMLNRAAYDAAVNPLKVDMASLDFNRVGPEKSEMADLLPSWKDVQSDIIKGSTQSMSEKYKYAMQRFKDTEAKHTPTLQAKKLMNPWAFPKSLEEADHRLNPGNYQLMKLEDGSMAYMHKNKISDAKKGKLGKQYLNAIPAKASGE